MEPIVYYSIITIAYSPVAYHALPRRSQAAPGPPGARAASCRGRGRRRSSLHRQGSTRHRPGIQDPKNRAHGLQQRLLGGRQGRELSAVVSLSAPPPCRNSNQQCRNAPATSIVRKCARPPVFGTFMTTESPMSSAWAEGPHGLHVRSGHDRQLLICNFDCVIRLAC